MTSYGLQLITALFFGLSLKMRFALSTLHDQQGRGFCANAMSQLQFFQVLIYLDCRLPPFIDNGSFSGTYHFHCTKSLREYFVL